MIRSPLHRSDRRKALLALGGALAASHGPASASTRTRLRTSARIVIAGAGAAGLAAAAQLAQRLDGARITLVDARREHYYQPGFTLVGGGIKPVNYVVSRTSDYIPAGVTWVDSAVAEFDPDGQRIVTASGQTLAYDQLIVATGLSFAWERIAGMDPAAIGHDGLGCVYQGPAAAAATWQAMSQFVDRGGRGLFLRPATEMKCAGAPLKYTFITEDHLTRRGTRSRAELVYNAHDRSLFGVPIVSEKVRMLFEQRGIKVNHERVLQAIDPGRRIATFATAQGRVEEDYDFIHVVPPMQAPEAVRRSPLPWQTGAWAADGWLEVDPGTLRHRRYPNVFGIGDVAGVPKGKTAASVKWQVPVVVDHLVAGLAGQTSQARYDGYTSCPLITRLGRAMLIEFDYRNNLVPSFPGVIAPLEELWVSWVMKTMALKPTYISMLRGLA